MYYFDNNGRQMLACSCNIYSKEHPLKHCDGCLAMNTVCFMLEKQQHISMDASKLKIPTHGVFYLFTNLNKIALKTTTEYDVRGDHICGICEHNNENKSQIYIKTGGHTVVIIVGYRDAILMSNDEIEPYRPMLMLAHRDRHKPHNLRYQLDEFFTKYNKTHRVYLPILTPPESPITNIYVLFDQF